MIPRRKKIISNVELTAVSSAVPKNKIDNQQNSDFSDDEKRKIISSTGVETRYVADQDMCASDLCFYAANHLFDELEIDVLDIDIIVFVSQTPDHILPATACIMQDRLGLKKSTIAFDINLGCSGYAYGVMLLANMLSTGIYKKALLLAGDTISKLTSPQDRSVAFLFGDAGSATLLEYSEKASPLYFDFGTDGSGFDKLIVETGAFRSWALQDTVMPKAELLMSGMDVFSFTLREVPKTINTCMTEAGLDKDQVDHFFFHQANKFMLLHLAKKMKISLDKVPFSIREYGNTSVASIPLTMSTLAKHANVLSNQTILLSGFGVGFSWATVIMHCSAVRLFEPIFI